MDSSDAILMHSMCTAHNGTTGMHMATVHIQACRSGAVFANLRHLDRRACSVQTEQQAQ